MDLILLLSADIDIQSAFEKYDGYQEGRGEVFMRQLDACLGLLRQQPFIAPTFAGNYRRLLMTDFPLGIFYEVQPTRIVVNGIMDLRQDPKEITRRLFGRAED